MINFNCFRTFASGRSDLKNLNWKHKKVDYKLQEDSFNCGIICLQYLISLCYSFDQKTTKIYCEGFKPNELRKSIVDKFREITGRF